MDLLAISGNGDGAPRLHADGPEPADWLAIFEPMRTRGSRAPEPPFGAAE